VSVKSDLVLYIGRSDCDVVLGRVPPELKSRLREVFVWNHSQGMRVLGWVRTYGRRDINLAGYLPPRLSLRRCVGRHRNNSAREFGAPERGQWPPWSVRRYLLYSTLLHELGHLQVVEPRARRNQRKFGSEGFARAFANDVRRELYATWFDHADPVHNPPTEAELSFIPVWERLDKSEKRRLLELVLTAPHAEIDLRWLEPLDHAQRMFVDNALRGRRLREIPPTFIDRRDPDGLRRFAAVYHDAIGWDVDLAWNVGWAFFRLEAPSEALPIFDAALLIAPDHAKSWFGLGVVHRELGDLNRADRCLRESLVREESWLTRLCLAVTSLELDRPAEGESLLRRGLELRPDPTPEMRRELADYLEDVDKYIEADLIRAELDLM
jgi:tetratricopeptide (TPR) repeat protein